MLFFPQNFQVLRHRITPTGRFPTSKGTEAISAMPCPKNVSGVKRFLGMVGYFREYIRNMSNRTKHRFVQFCVKALSSNGYQLMMLNLQISKRPSCVQALCFFILIGIVLLSYILTPRSMVSAQMHYGHLHPVKFASRSFTPT